MICTRALGKNYRLKLCTLIAMGILTLSSLSAAGSWDITTITTDTAEASPPIAITTDSVRGPLYLFSGTGNVDQILSTAPYTKMTIASSINPPAAPPYSTPCITYDSSRSTLYAIYGWAQIMSVRTFPSVIATEIGSPGVVSYPPGQAITYNSANHNLYVLPGDHKVTPKVKNTKQLFLRRDSSLVSLSFAA